MDGTGWNCRPYKTGTLLYLHVQPGVRKTGLKKSSEGLICLKLNARPIDGAANKACVQYFSDLCRIPKTKIEIIRGLRSREKQIWFKEIPPSALLRILPSSL